MTFNTGLGFGSKLDTLCAGQPTQIDIIYITDMVIYMIL